MQKIVVNDRHSGFGLSYKGVKEYFKRKGINVFAYEGEFISEVTYVEIFNQIFTDARFCTHYSTLDKPTLTSEEINENYITDRYIPRDDPDLVDMVENMDGIQDSMSKLKVVEIPDGIAWQIGEYDGAEWVEEKHRCWY